MNRKKMFASVACAFFAATVLVGCGGGKKPEDTMKDDLIRNFWESDTMYDETVILVAPMDEDGNITAMPSGRLLFEADEILSVKQYFHAEHSGEVEYKQGVDFEYSDGTITAKGTIEEDIDGKKTEVNTSMPYITERQYLGKDVFPGCSTTVTGIPSADGNWDIPYTESYQIVQLQISVTYKHSAKWTKNVPAYMGDKLPNAISKLKSKQHTDILVFGDSISTGANSSSVLKIHPNLPAWYELMETELERAYGADITLTNKSMGGWTSMQAVSENPSDGWVGGELVKQKGLPALLREEMTDYSPDFAIIAFGMNDATLNVGLNNYANNIRKVIDSIRARNADCDIILVGTMLANPQARNQCKNQSEYSALNLKIAEQYENVACVDVGAMHKDLLDSGKKYMDMTGNNVNHPNDFMARIYGMNLLSLLVE